MFVDGRYKYKFGGYTLRTQWANRSAPAPYPTYSREPDWLPRSKSDITTILSVVSNIKNTLHPWNVYCQSSYSDVNMTRV